MSLTMSLKGPGIRRYDNVDIFHGWKGIADEGWLPPLAADLRKEGINVHLHEFPDPMHPDRVKWVASARRYFQLKRDPDNTLIFTHSLGGITLWHLAAEFDVPVAHTAVFVAPPYLSYYLLPDGAPASVKTFAELAFLRGAALRIAKHPYILGGESDFYCTSDQNIAFRKWLRTKLYMVKDAKHFSPGAGYGHWHWPAEFALGRVGFPPKPAIWKPKHLR